MNAISLTGEEASVVGTMLHNHGALSVQILCDRLRAAGFSIDVEISEVIASLVKKISPVLRLIA